MYSETRIVNREDLPALAREVLEMASELQNSGPVVVALRGDLGAGKTTFVQTLGKLLGVGETITSPTFTIMKGYETTDTNFKHLIHMDAYRIDDLAELGPLKFADILNTPQTLICVEWADRILPALPELVINLNLAVVDENTRTAHLSLQ